VGVLKTEQQTSIDLESDDVASIALKKAAENAKITMSRKSGARIQIPKVTERNGRPIGLETVVKRDQFNAMIKDLVDRTLVEVKKALEHAKLDKSDIDTVLMVGGSTYIPLVQETVRDFFGKEPNKTVNPDLAVALGAAASLLLEGDEGGKHVVTVGFVPETTPDEKLEIEGRTTPNSKVRIECGDVVVNTEADETGEYLASVALKQGMNSMVITATSPDGQETLIKPEPVVLDPNAEEVEEPPAPPQPRLARALSVSVVTAVGPSQEMPDSTSVILPTQTELPVSFTADGFSTRVDNQRELIVPVLEGDLPLGGLNTQLSEVNLRLPPNVPGGEPVLIHFSVDESFVLTAEVEVPAVNRRAQVQIDLKATNVNVPLFDQIGDFLNKHGEQLRPEDRARLEKSKLAVEDICANLRRLLEAEDDGAWNSYIQLKSEVDRLTTTLNDLKKKYR
ncbi:MAG: Hsp70 family protein, partial [Planctomycetes bacterium]|nr:Hsp70 family protein [Planctomycetota bacterium]